MTVDDPKNVAAAVQDELLELHTKRYAEAKELYAMISKILHSTSEQRAYDKLDAELRASDLHKRREEAHARLEAIDLYLLCQMAHQSMNQAHDEFLEARLRFLPISDQKPSQHLRSEETNDPENSSPLVDASSHDTSPTTVVDNRRLTSKRSELGTIKKNKSHRSKMSSRSREKYTRRNSDGNMVDTDGGRHVSQVGKGMDAGEGADSNNDDNNSDA